MFYPFPLRRTVVLTPGVNPDPDIPSESSSMVKDAMSIPHSRRTRKGAAKKNTRGAHASRNAGFPLFYWARRISARSLTLECMPSASFDDKKNSDFLRRVSRRVGRAWGGRMRWERVDASRRGRRGYFARRAVVGPTWGPVRTPRAGGGADTSHARGAFMYGSYRNTKPKRLGNASVWC